MSGKEQKARWKAAAEAAMEALKPPYRRKSPEKPMPLRELDANIRLSREFKTEGDRGKTEYETVRNVIINEMMRRSLPERTAGRRTACILVPDLELGTNETGKKKFQKLCSTMGMDWAQRRVVITTHYLSPRSDVSVVEDPRVRKGAVLRVVETWPEEVVVEYTFIGKGTTRQKLRWTVAMGNRPVYKVGDTPTRVKQGKLRNAKKKKANRSR